MRLVRWFRANPVSISMSLLIGSLCGFALGFWLTYQPPAWIEFADLKASHVLGSKVISVSGKYLVNRECDSQRPVIWRTEALATDGQVAIYGPRPEPPPLTLGSHEYVSEIPLKEDISPDGWAVSVITTCSNELPPTVASHPALVSVTRP